MSQSFKWFSALVVLLFGIGTYVAMTNRSLGPLPTPFNPTEMTQEISSDIPENVTQESVSATDYTTFAWKNHGFSMDIPTAWQFYPRDYLLVMAGIDEANKDMIPNAIDNQTYRIQYSAYPEIAIFSYPELSLEERLGMMNECTIDKKEIFTQVNCEELLPGGNHGTAKTQFYFFTVGQSLYEVAIGDIALSQTPEQVDHIINSIKFD